MEEKLFRKIIDKCGIKMKLQSSRILMFVLIGVLFFSILPVYAETAKDYYNKGLAVDRAGGPP